VPRGLAWGALGVLIFAFTLPMTRLAVGDEADPQLPPGFVTAGRAAVAGVLAALYLWAIGAAVPSRRLWPALAASAVGTVVGFPLFLALALRQVDAMHAAVVTGVLPLATAVVGALAFRQRPSAGFWAAAVGGCALVLAYAAWQGSGRLGAADGLLLLAVASAAVGYVAGARVATEMPAPQVISWVLVGSLPLTAPVAGWLWPEAPVRASAWLGFGYAAVFSMWLGFFAWYHGLVTGGVLRVSQVQLLQPFLALIAAALLLGERPDAPTMIFTLAVLGVVWLGKSTKVAR
jgi:drug/metabolite transporter (DMT)-like permease